MDCSTLRAWVLLGAALPALAQQSGAVAGKVVSGRGAALPGVRVRASAEVLPTARVAVTDRHGDYRLANLPPGDYILDFSHPDGGSQSQRVQVLLQQTTSLSLVLGPAAVPGAVVEVTGHASLVDPGSAELKTAIPSEVLRGLPLGKDYRSLVALIPAVPYAQTTVRDPSSGGSGQDNLHLFDGVNVNLPMYGTAFSEPSSHDIDQVAVSKGGAAAIDFNRSAGFTLNSVSKSGTRTFTGELSYQTFPASLIAAQKGSTALRYNDSQTFSNGSVGGPLIADQLFFFVSYFRPTDSRDNSSNAYGALPAFRSVRDEYFAKLTYAPSSTLLVHASHRDSTRTYRNQVTGGALYAPSTTDGGRITMAITSLEAVWSLSPSQSLNLKMSDFGNRNADRPDLLASAVPALDGSGRLDVQHLASQGQFAVPLPAAASVAGAAAYNAAIAPIIAQYGYLLNGVRTGGGVLGSYPILNSQNFYRRTYQLSYDATLGRDWSHALHVGYQWYRDSEDLDRRSNGWGALSMPIGVTTPNTHQAASFVAAVQQQGNGAPGIHSEYLVQNIEVNDKLQWRAFTFNLGAMVSQDGIYGQGLAEDASTVSGYVLAPGHKYLEHRIRFQDTLQPRLGLTWNYRGQDTVYAHYARYVPTTPSLPRGASWARNLIATVNVYFDGNGSYLDRATDPGSTGKLYASGIKPRHTDEYLVGTTRQWAGGLSSRLYARYRYSCNFWEDTRNDARTLFEPPAGIARTLYVPNLVAKLTQLGVTLDPRFPNNQYVIAQVDTAFTKYYQAALELEWKSEQAFVSLSYAWSHYYGNFDQDNTTTALANDSNIFVGSSNLADDAGKQLWDRKYGNLTGDRRHQIKLFGTCRLPWQAQVGAFAVYQSGQPWQYASYSPYLALITASGSTSRSDTNRYAEPAGSRVSAPHYQLDLNYSQTLWHARGLTASAMIELFNVFNRQTGYDFQASVHAANPGVAQSSFAPRRTQLGVSLRF